MRAPAAVVLALVAFLVAVPGTAAAAGSQPVHPYAEAIRETVWVDTGADIDRDGKHNRVAADITRPGIAWASSWAARMRGSSWRRSTRQR